MSKDIPGWIEQCKIYILAKDVFPRIWAPMTCINVTLLWKFWHCITPSWKCLQLDMKMCLFWPTCLPDLQLPSPPRTKQHVRMPKPSSNTGLSIMCVQLDYTLTRKDALKLKWSRNSVKCMVLFPIIPKEILSVRGSTVPCMICWDCWYPRRKSIGKLTFQS